MSELVDLGTLSKLLPAEKLAQTCYVMSYVPGRLFCWDLVLINCAFD